MRAWIGLALLSASWLLGRGRLRPGRRPRVDRLGRPGNDALALGVCVLGCLPLQDPPRLPGEGRGEGNPGKR